MKKNSRVALIFAMAIFMLSIIAANIQEVIVTKKYETFISTLQTTKYPADHLNRIVGISIDPVEYNDKAKAIKFKLQNNTRGTIYYGDAVTLETRYKDEWFVIPYSGNAAFTSILNYLSPMDESVRSIPVSVWRPLAEGEYRIIYEVSIKEGFKELYPISGDFRVIK